MNRNFYNLLASGSQSLRLGENHGAFCGNSFGKPHGPSEMKIKFHGVKMSANFYLRRGTVEGLLKKMNIEHRTSNVEHRIMMSLRSAIKFHLISKIRCQTFNDCFCFFLFSHLTFDVGRSMFDVHLLKRSCTA